MAVLITGGAGFIGSHLVEKLSETEDEVIVLDDFTSGRQNIAVLDKLTNVSIITGSITNFELIKDLASSSSRIYHLAALNRVPRSIEDPLLANEVNITGTLNILEAARNSDVEEVLFSSSSSVYGNSDKFPRKENGEVIPKNPYAVGKLAAENYCKVYQEIYGLKVKILRYFAVYGPRQSPNIKYAAVVPLFLRNAIYNEVLPVFGDGMQRRNFTYVSDVVDATIRIMDTKKTNGMIINIANESEVSLNDIVKLLKDITNKELLVRYLPWRIGDVKRVSPDISRLKEIIGFNPNISIEEGLRRSYIWYKANLTYFN